MKRKQWRRGALTSAVPTELWHRPRWKAPCYFGLWPLRLVSSAMFSPKWSPLCALNESPAIHFGNTRGGKRSIRIAARKRLQIGRPDQCVTQGPGRPGRSLANAFAHGVVRANQNPIGTRIDRIIVDWVSNRGGRPTGTAFRRVQKRWRVI